ncbi:signal recognition particle receptor beta subunit-domain-containing protein [Gloeopeniophorella convolvens]|nr:signal recognition particle receptor beta subunit-domain-containing protein [Gloeopeniophorella convolvens]
MARGLKALESEHGDWPTPSPLAMELPIVADQKLLLLSLLGAVLLVVVALYLARRRSRPRGNSVILAGASDAGKTAILSALTYKETLPSHASLQTNTSIFSLNKRTFTLVDVPGHPRIRSQFSDHLPDAKAIVFVVDASNISRNGPVVAEHLHHILHTLVNIPPSQSPPAVLILAHKCDLLKTGSSSAATSSDQLAINRVRAVLERELEKRRLSHTGSVTIDGLGAEGEDRAELGGLDSNGSTSEPFKFTDWEGGDIDFVGTWTSVGEKLDLEGEKSAGGEGIRGLIEWLEGLP